MLECQILNWGGDRVYMANSMESRPAFLDHHVAAMAVQIPSHYRIHGNTEKWVLREAMQHILPPVLYKREKFAFMVHPSHTDQKKQRALAELTNTYMDPGSIRDAGWFVAGWLQAFLEGYRRDADPVYITRCDAVMNHLMGVNI